VYVRTSEMRSFVDEATVRAGMTSTPNSELQQSASALVQVGVIFGDFDDQGTAWKFALISI
jgi:hypothetical protein